MKHRLHFIIRAAALLAVAGIGLAGCAPTEQTIVHQGPDFEQTKDVDLDFVQIHNDTIDAFGDADNNPYVFITDFNVNGDNEQKTVTIDAVCMDDTTEEEAKQFAAAAVRHVNDAAVTQSNEYELSSQQSFGTLFSKYALTLSIKPQSTQEDKTTWLVDLELEPGEDIPLDPDIETYEEEWADTRDAYLESLREQAVVIGSEVSGEETEARTEADGTAEDAGADADTAEGPVSAVD